MKRLKAAPAKKLRQIYNPQGIAQIRLIRAEFQHSPLITDYRIGRLRHLKALRRKFFKGRRQHFFSRLKHVLLGGNAHLKIKLIKFAGGPVRPCILVPEAGRNLKIFIHP